MLETVIILPGVEGLGLPLVFSVAVPVAVPIAG